MKFFYDIPTWRTLVVLLAPVVLGSSAQAIHRVRYISNLPQSVDVVIVAHPDDWQLFMGDIVARQVRVGNPVVLIYLTAGDDGRDSLYWAMRERGRLGLPTGRGIKRG